eukprot:scaffold1206_cov388-Prasinococcus_capsulatus_cf.AAC.15
MVCSVEATQSDGPRLTLEQPLEVSLRSGLSRISHHWHSRYSCGPVYAPEPPDFYGGRPCAAPQSRPLSYSGHGQSVLLALADEEVGSGSLSQPAVRCHRQQQSAKDHPLSSDSTWPSAKVSPGGTSGP